VMCSEAGRISGATEGSEATNVSEPTELVMSWDDEREVIWMDGL
jgi:hypothetical protein